MCPGVCSVTMAALLATAVLEGQLGTDRLLIAAPILPPPPEHELLATLKSKDAYQRMVAVETVLYAEAHRAIFEPNAGKSQYRADKVVPLLLRTLTEDVPLLRRGAADALFWYAEDERVLPALVAALKDREAGPPYDSTVASCAADTLAELKGRARPALPALIEAVAKGDELLAASACRALGRIARADRTAVPQAVPALAAVVKDIQRGPQERCSAAKALGLLGADAKAAVPALRVAIYDREMPLDFETGPYLGREALYALESMGPEAAEALPDLVALMLNKDYPSRAVAAGTIGALGAKAESVVPLLRQVAKVHSIGGEHLEAEWALVRILPVPDPDPLPPILKGIKDKQREVRVKALDEFGQRLLREFRFRPREQRTQIVAVLLEALRDEWPPVRRQAATYLWAYEDDERVLPALLAAVKDEDDGGASGDGVALRAAVPLRRRAPRTAIPVLLRGRRPLDVEVLGIIGKDEPTTAPVVVQELLALFTDKQQDPLRRTLALRSLGLMGRRARRAVPAILKELKDMPPNLRLTASDSCLLALGRIGPGAACAIPDMVAILQEKKAKYGVRLFAAQALGGMGKGAKAAIPALQDASRDQNEFVRKTARKALKQIEP